MCSFRLGDNYTSLPLEAFAIDAVITVMYNLVALKAREKELHFPINLGKDFKVVIDSRKSICSRN